MFIRKICRIDKNIRAIIISKHGYCTEKKEKKSWRRPWIERKGEWTSGLSVFSSGKGPSTDYLRFVQSDIDLRPGSIKRWWNKMKERGDLENERYIPERHQILGNDLAAAHFIVHRGGAVRFYGPGDWIRQDENEEYDLPSFYDPNYCIEAIDASKMGIHFEGLRNIMGLKRIKWLSFEGCPFIDNWCLDRISGEFQESLEYLDIRNCPKIDEKGLNSLYRMSNLKKLLVTNSKSNKIFELVCLMLEEIHPNLNIDGISYIAVTTESNEPDNLESK